MRWLGLLASFPAMNALAFSPDDPLYSQQWNLEAVVAAPAWDVADGSGIRVAVVDTGVLPDHPDGPANLLTDIDFDFVNQDDNTTDGNGFGTAITGIIAAGLDNGVGVSGIAPQAEILPVQVLSAGGQGSFAAVIAGIDWAVANNADIIMLALGVPDAAPGGSALDDVASAVRRATDAGILVVAAAGDTGGETLFPAAMPEVIAVGAVDRSLAATAWTAGNDNLDIVAPGVEIPTLALSGFSGRSGTAFAAAHVAGAAALVWSNSPQMTADDVRMALLSTALDLGLPGVDPVYGFGLLQISAALGIADCSDVQEDLDECLDALADSESDVASLTGLVGECETQLETVQMQRDDALASLVVATTRIGELEGELALCEADTDRLQFALGACESDRADLQLRVDVLEDERDVLAARIASLTEALDLSEAQVGVLIDERDALVSQVASLTEAVEDALAQLDAMTDERDQLLEQVEVLSAVNTRLEADLLSCSTDLMDEEASHVASRECIVAVDRLIGMPALWRRWNRWGYTRRTFDDDPECDRIVTRLLHPRGWWQ